jgi:membrane protein
MQAPLAGALCGGWAPDAPVSACLPSGNASAMNGVKRLPAQLKLRVETARSRWGPVDVALRTFKQFSLDDGGSYTAALTYYFFFSIFPLLLFAAAVLGFLTQGNTELRNDILEAGRTSVPLVGSLLSEDSLKTIEENSGRLGLLGAVLALYSGSGAVVALSHGLNKINNVDEERTFVAKRLRSLMWLGILGGAALLSVGLGALAGNAGRLFDSTAAQAASFLLGHLVGFSIGVLIFASAFRYLPNKELSWEDVLPGAVVASFLFEILKEIGSWYLAQGAQSRQETFGTLAAAAGLLVASYLISRITLLSAELNDVLLQRRRTRAPNAV